MGRRWIYSAGLVSAIVALTSCGRTGHVSGGTTGVLHAGSVLLSDVQVTLHRVDGTATEAIGIGTTRANGRFELVQPGARQALHLSPGEYRVTVESVGAVPLSFARDFESAETSPLRVNWTSKSAQLDLEVPLLTVDR